jgi:hypothetical protein
MRAYILAAAAAAFLVVPSFAFSQEIHIGPGGVRVGPGYHDHYRGDRCRELRAACIHKEELGEQGMGNCRRYRAMCG